MPFPLTAEQRLVVNDRGGALLVSAAAGSGKTRVLVERLLERVEREKHDIDEFLVITFTNAAAAELRGRIAQELTQRLAQDPGNSVLRRQITRVYKAQICTIDALCIDLLRQHGHLLNVDPDFRICDQAESDAIALRVLDELLNERYESMDADPGFSALADAVLTGRDDLRLMNIVLDIHARIQSHPDPERWLNGRRNDFRAEGALDAGETPWGALILKHVRDQAMYWQGEIARALELAAEDPVLDMNYSGSLLETQEALEELANAAGWDGALSCFPIPFPRAGVKRGADPELKERIADLRKRCKSRMETLQALFGADSATVLGELRGLSPAVESLFDLVREFGQRFYREKSHRGLLEFSDAEHLTVRLLERDEVRDLLRGQFTEIMVDEYQDTNEVQNVLFDALSRDGENLFLVGDVKQSIYRFRLADPAIFLHKYESWSPAACAAGEPHKLFLSCNFRSRPQVLHAVNYVFETIMSRECGEMEYGVDEQLIPAADFTDDPVYATEFDVIDLPESGGGEDGVDKNLIEARFVARRMAEMLREGFPVSDGAGGTRPIRPDDMVILLRSPGPVLRHYTRALTEAGIPVETESGGDFFETTEISVALSLLEVIDNPRQDVPLLSVLRSPLFGFSPDRLSQIRAGKKDGDFYSAMEADGGADCTAFLKKLRLLRFRAGEMSARRLIERLYSETDMMAVFGAMPNGAERQANLAALREQAGSLERSGHKGLYAFLTQLGRMRQRGDSFAPAVSGAGGVRILSIHRSKGLEFPVVFLCGLGRQFNKMDAAAPVLFHQRLGVGPKYLERGDGWTVEWPTLARQAVALQMDREMKAEEMRLLYVAMTRAKEKLIMSMSMSGAGAAIEKLARDAARPAAPAVVAAASSAGRWILLSALTRPDADALYAAAGLSLVTVSRSSDPKWDVRVVSGGEYEIPLRARGEVGDESPAVPEERVDALAAALAWKYPHAQAVDLPSKLTATQLKGRSLDMEAAEDADAPRPVWSAPFQRPDFAAQKLGLTAPQRGTALHKVLQYLDFDQTGSAEAIEREISRLIERQFITAEEGRSADALRLAEFFASPLGQELLNAPVREREYKFSLLAPGEEFFPGAEGEEILFQGVIDCWFENENGITILDFKTDRVPKPEQYRPQVEVYTRALEELLGKPVARKALYFFASGQTFFL